MKSKYYKHNIQPDNQFIEVGTLYSLPDINSWNFLESFYPKYDSCPDIDYLNHLINFLDGVTDREQLTNSQPDTKGMSVEEIKSEWKRYYQNTRNKASIHFYELLTSGNITLFYSDKQIILDTSDRKLYENTEEQKYYDLDIIGYGNIRRAKILHNIKRGDIFNIYRGESTKNGCEWQGTLDKSLNKFLDELETEI